MGINLNLDLTQQPKVVLQVKMMGVYAAGTDYSVGDAVTYNGGTYYMHTDAAAGTAPTETANWQAINSPNDYVESLTSFTLTNATTDNTISVDQNGNVGTDVSTDGAVHIENTGNTGIGLGVYTNIGDTADAPLVSISADNAAFDQQVFKIVNDGTNLSLYIDSNLASNSSGVLTIDDASTNGSNNTLRVNSSRGGTGGGAVFVDQNGVGKGIWIDKDVTNANNAFAGLQIDHTSVVSDAGTYTKTAAVVQINSNVTETSGTITDSSICLEINQTHDGATGATLKLNHDGNGAHISFVGDPANSSSSDGDLWFDGTNLKMKIGTTVYNIDMTAV